MVPPGRASFTAAPNPEGDRRALANPLTSYFHRAAVHVRVSEKVAYFA
jgi:hypothetical protein